MRRQTGTRRHGMRRQEAASGRYATSARRRQGGMRCQWGKERQGMRRQRVPNTAAINGGSVRRKSAPTWAAALYNYIYICCNMYNNSLLLLYIYTHVFVMCIHIYIYICLVVPPRTSSIQIWQGSLKPGSPLPGVDTCTYREHNHSSVDHDGANNQCKP